MTDRTKPEREPRDPTDIIDPYQRARIIVFCLIVVGITVGYALFWMASG